MFGVPAPLPLGACRASPGCKPGDRTGGVVLLGSAKLLIGGNDPFEEMRGPIGLVASMDLICPFRFLRDLHSVVSRRISSNTSSLCSISMSVIVCFGL